MPRRPRAGGTPEEEFAAWFNRMDVPIEGTYSETALGDFLAARMDAQGYPAPTQDQVAGLWGNLVRGFDLQEVGIKSFLQRATIGPQLRFGITGMRGSFGITRARQIYTERTGRPAPY